MSVALPAHGGCSARSQRAARPSRAAPAVRGVPMPYVGVARSGYILEAAPSLAARDFGAAVRGAVASAAPTSGPRCSPTRMMPIGVPRVPYRMPKEGVWQWIDIWNCMYRDRIVFLQKPVDDELGNQLVATLLYLDSESDKDIKLYINCTGGEVVPCLALHDTMRYIKSDVATVGFGACMGMSGFLLATGAKGKRCALPNTRIMLHHPSGAARGQAGDINEEARELMRVRNYMNRVLSGATGKSLKRVQHDFQRNAYFDVDEAIEYGVIDRVLPPPRTLKQELDASKAKPSPYPKEWAA